MNPKSVGCGNSTEPVVMVYTGGTTGKSKAVLNGVDMIVFTGGIGENSSYVRRAVCDSLSYAGIELDEASNSMTYGCREISNNKSKVKVVVVPANEELMIARETVNTLSK